MTAYKKLAITAGISAALAGASFSSHAIIEGAAGEALLVPFVLYDQPGQTNPNGVWINTIIEITVPSSVGADTVPNFFTAPNTTPTNGLLTPTRTPTNPALGEEDYTKASLHWYFFDEKSGEVNNGEIPTSGDDFSVINWGDIVCGQPFSNLCDIDMLGQKGYLVITNHKESWGWRNAARFPMFGDAYMVWPAGFGIIDTKIPVLPMSDGKDSSGEGVTMRNQVIHDSDGNVIQVSPLAAGMRIGRSDGESGDYTLFDLTLSNRFLPTLHVIWQDSIFRNASPAIVFDDQEQWCSTGFSYENELNVFWTSPYDLFPRNFQEPLPETCLDEDPENDPDFGCQQIVPPLDWVDAASDLCFKTQAISLSPRIVRESDILYPGFVRLRINEGGRDTNIDSPEASAVAFSIQLQVDVLDNTRSELVFPPQLLPIETALGHERGTFTVSE